MAALLGGFAAVDITPPLGVCLAGHFNRRVASGLHDPLTAQALVFELAGTRLALVGCDLIGIPAELTALVRGQLADLPAEQLMIFGTHTHAGPVLTAGGAEGRDEEYFQVLAGKLAGAVRAATAQLRPVDLRVAWGEENRISHNRRYRLKDGSVRTNPGVGNPEISRVDGPKDPAVGALFVSDAAGLQAVLVNFACHLDVLGNGNFLFSADYAYYLRQTLQRAYGRPLVVPFANGPCGNINHINVFGQRRQGGYDLAQMMGMLLAGEVLKIEGRAEPLPLGELHGRLRTLELPRRPYSEAELAEFEATLANDRIPDRAYPKVRARTHLQQHRSGSAMSAVEVQALRLGDLALLGVPGEYFVEYGLRLRQQSGAAHTFVVELANDCIGYLPTPEAFDEGGYEGTSARFGRDTGEQMATALLGLLAVSP